MQHCHLLEIVRPPPQVSDASSYAQLDQACLRRNINVHCSLLFPPQSLLITHTTFILFLQIRI